MLLLLFALVGIDFVFGRRWRALAAAVQSATGARRRRKIDKQITKKYKKNTKKKQKKKLFRFILINVFYIKF